MRYYHKAQGDTGRGFTIVETLIVLAVAGLILSIVLLAVPALERSSRNNQRRQDVQTILAAVSHYELNNSGNMPGAPPASPFLKYYKLTYYDSTSVKYLAPGASGGTTNGINVYVSSGWTDAEAKIGGSSQLDEVDVYNHEKCLADNSGGAGSSGAGYSDVVALYAIETHGGTAPQCEQL